MSTHPAGQRAEVKAGCKPVHFIIQKDNSLITFKYRKIQSKGFNLVFLLENNIL
ncbi:zeta toxin, partial [Campylobacter jejuni]|nr:zeta toxin [Campylobacter jejuni]